MLVETQVRQALQQTATVGACSPYLTAVWLTWVVQNVRTTSEPTGRSASPG